MEEEHLISRSQLAVRWSVTPKTIDRLRKRGDLAWVDVACGKGGRPLVRFLLRDIRDYEIRNRLAPFAKEAPTNDKK